MHDLIAFLRNAALLFGLWLLFSNRYEPFFLTLGLVSSGAIAWLNSRQPGHDNPTIPFLRFAVYLPKLGWRILLSNLQVARMILHPRLPVAPEMIRYRTRLRHPAAVVLLAHSITLTPGTVTADVDSRELTVHGLDQESVKELASGTLENEIAWIFGEER
jgi:multicomponent Na+:H+ antiporter subunit E